MNISKIEKGFYKTGKGIYQGAKFAYDGLGKVSKEFFRFYFKHPIATRMALAGAATLTALLATGSADAWTHVPAGTFETHEIETKFYDVGPDGVRGTIDDVLRIGINHAYTTDKWHNEHELVFFRAQDLGVEKLQEIDKNTELCDIVKVQAGDAYNGGVLGKSIEYSTRVGDRLLGVCSIIIGAIVGSGLWVYMLAKEMRNPNYKKEINSTAKAKLK